MKHEYRVYLADDEPVILRGLRKLIDWESLGCVISGIAENGDALYQAILRNEADIVVSDIRMPGMSGIDVLKLISQRTDAPAVLFVSGYREFTFVREALALQAVDYILKPIDARELEEAVVRAVERLSRRRLETERETELGAARQSARIQESQGLLARLLRSDRHAESSQIADQIRLGFFGDVEPPQIVLCVVPIDILLRSPRSANAAGNGKTVETLTVSLHTALGGAAVMCVIDELLCIIADGDILAPDVLSDILGAAAHKMQRHPIATICDAPAAFLDVLDHIEMGEGDSSADGDIDQACITAVLTLDGAGARRAISRILGGVRVRSAADIPQGINATLNLLLRITQALSDSGVPFALAAGWADRYAELGQAASYVAMKETLDSIVDDVVSNLGSARERREREEIRALRTYVQEHCGEVMTLAKAARIVGMNPTYVSSFFKKETGENFKDYVLRVKMQEALRMLLAGSHRIYEIAYSLGYSEPGHFATAFKRHFGRAPADVRRSRTL